MANPINMSSSTYLHRPNNTKDQSQGGMPHHHSSSHPPRQPQRNSVSAATVKTSSSGMTAKDPFYGHEANAKLCARAIKHIFGCTDDSISLQSGSGPTEKTLGLAKFIAYAFHRTRLPECVAYHALMLLTRLKMRYPNASCAHGHRLFLTAYMLSSKVICDDTYSNKSWAIVGQGFYELRDVNLMEREMISFLSWDITFPGEVFETFKEKIKANYGQRISSHAMGIVPIPEIKKQAGHEYFGRGQIVMADKPVVPLPDVELNPNLPAVQKVQGPVHILPSLNIGPHMFPVDPPPMYSPNTPSPISDSGSNSPDSPYVITPTDDGVSLPAAFAVQKYTPPGQGASLKIAQVQEVDGHTVGWTGNTVW